MVRRVVFILLLLGVIGFNQRSASAQIVNVYVEPGWSTYTVGTPVTFVVDFCSDAGSFTIGPDVLWGGAPVDGISWSYPSPFCSNYPDSRRATGTVTVLPGATELFAYAYSVDVYGEGRVDYIGVQPPPPPGVTPDAEPATISPVTGAQQRFDILNVATLEETGTTAQTYTLSVGCTGAATACSVNPTTIEVPNGSTGSVTATFSISGALGASGVVTVTATGDGGSDPGTLNVTVGPSGPLVDRSKCVTIATGGGAAFECGDLRLVHLLPGVRTLNKARAPALLYNSQQARPYPIVQVDVTAPSPLPQTIRGIVRIGGVIRGQRDMPGSSWVAAGLVRRFGIAFPLDTVTGLYDYQLELQRVDGGSPVTFQMLNGQLPIVNRKASAFGPGWSLAGWERLVFTGLPATPQVMWVGGDGSVRRYDRVGAVGVDTAYLATPLDRPDTLLHKSNGEWVRLERGGLKVTFNSSGVHRFTTTRVGQVTEFVDSSGVLKQILLPPSAAGLTYTFAYSGSPLRLQSVTVPDSAVGANRVTLLEWVTDTLRITDPGTPAWVLRYETGGTNRIVYARNPRSAVTLFDYDEGSRLAKTRLGVPFADSIKHTFCAAEVRGLATCSPVLVLPESAYTIYDGPRLPTDSSDVTHLWIDRFGQVTQMRDAYQNITTLNRTDPRWPAAVTRVQYANGRKVGATYDRRGNIASSTDSSTMLPVHTSFYTWDQRWDEITESKLPTGEVTRFGYDVTNGNRLWQEDGRGSSSRVNFTYYSGALAGLPQLVTVPGGAKDSLGYDAAGNLSLTRTPMSDTTFYVNDRLGRTRVTKSKVATTYRHDSTYYDVRGRPIRVVAYGPSLNGQSSRRLIVQNFFSQDGLLDSLTRSQSPDINPAVGVMTIRWRYDLAGRTVAEIAPDDRTSSGQPRVDSTRYDAASNAVERRTRRGHSITQVYDRMNRLKQRTVPSVTYPYRSQGIATMTVQNYTPIPYPWYTNDANGNLTVTNDGNDGLTISGDVSTFTYDAMGNMLTADNGDAKIKRTYFLDGMMQTDTIRLRTYAGNDFTQHVYGIQYAYDWSRRITYVYHPYQLRLATGGAGDQYAYDSLTGFLRQVTDLRGNVFSFDYNLRSEQVRVTMPGWISDTLIYDNAGRLIQDKIRNWSSSPHKHPDSLFRNTYFQYADPTRVSSATNLWGLRDTINAAYTGFGQLYQMTYRLPAYSNYGNTALLYSLERFVQDAFGNTYQNVDSTNLGRTSGFNTSYSSGSSYFDPPAGEPPAGRLRLKADVNRADQFSYDSAGNMVFSSTFPTPNVATYQEDRASFYSANGELRATEWRKVLRNPSVDPQSWVWWQRLEEFRYDALGRRVLSRARRKCYKTGLAEDCRYGTIARTVWNGSRELYEIRMPGGDTVSASAMENDTTPVNRPACWATSSPSCSQYFVQNMQYGRVAYTSAQVIDQPLSITRFNYEDQPWTMPYLKWAPFTIVPHWNWRGQADYGTFGDGGYRHCTTPQATRCVKIEWQVKAFAFTQAAAAADLEVGWFGSVRDLREDGANGMRYLRNRYLDPATGRFTQEDPIGLAGGLNLYGFAGGDPVNFDDPFGLCPWCVGALIGLGTYVVVDVLILGHDFDLGHAALETGAGALSGGLSALGKKAITEGVTIGLSATERAVAHLAVEAAPATIHGGVAVAVASSGHHSKPAPTPVPNSFAPDATRTSPASRSGGGGGTLDALFGQRQ